jgi:hypothetical protein
MCQNSSSKICEVRKLNECRNSITDYTCSNMIDKMCLDTLNYNYCYTIDTSESSCRNDSNYYCTPINSAAGICKLSDTYNCYDTTSD